jgi:hypothetical protein
MNGVEDGLNPGRLINKGTVVMVEDTTEQQPPAGDSGRVRRPPPTIDLQATEVSEQKAPEAAAPGAEASAAAVEPGSPSSETQSSEAPPEAQPQPEAAPERPGQARTRSGSPWIVAPLSGAVAAAAVVAIAFAMGWVPAEPPSRAPQPNAAAMEDLTARLTSLEARASRAPAAGPDQAAMARLEALEKSLAAVRGEVTSLRAQSDKLATAVSEARTLSAAPSSAAPDLSEISERIARIEQTSRAQAAQIAKDGEKIADAKPADDLALRRVVGAALLDLAVRHGDPYAALLTTAKSLAPSPDALKPLEAFAATGVPSPAGLDRDLLTLVPKLSPPAAESPTTGSSIVDRLQAGAAKLVRIERTDTAGTDRGAIVSRVTAAALRNDFTEARRELNALAPADRAAAQGWLDKADARDAALAASRHFADEAMASLATPAQ